MKISQLIQIGLLLLSSVSVSAMADTVKWTPQYTLPLETVSSVKDALNDGATVNATVDLSQCTRQGGGDPSTTTGGLRVSPFRIQGNGTLSFSDSHFTVSTRTQQPLMQFLRYQVVPEGGITVSSFIFSVPDYQLLSQVAFDCAINKGVSFYLP